MIRLLFFLGERLTNERTSGYRPLLIRTKWIEEEQRSVISLGHLVLFDGIPDVFVVSRTLIHKDQVIVVRLTLRAFAWAYARNLLLSCWYLFVEAAWLLGFLDFDAFDWPSAKHWRWAFWSKRRCEFPPRAPTGSLRARLYNLFRDRCSW